MKEYEIAAKFYNACAGSSRPQTFFEEAELNDPADYVRQKHGRDFEKFRKEVLANGQIVFSYDNGSVTYRYEFAVSFFHGGGLTRCKKPLPITGEMCYNLLTFMKAKET